MCAASCAAASLIGRNICYLWFKLCGCPSVPNKMVRARLACLLVATVLVCTGIVLEYMYCTMSASVAVGSIENILAQNPHAPKANNVMNVSTHLVEMFKPKCGTNTEKRKGNTVVDNKTGTWKLETCDYTHVLDERLAFKLLKMFDGQSVLELGAGCGCYASVWKHNGLKHHAYDGTANIAELTHGMVQYSNLAKPLREEPHDWVMSLEVGEHIPKLFEEQFLRNIVDHAKHGVVLSWAVPGQRGTGHVNCQPNDYIEAKMNTLGFTLNRERTIELRETARFRWFKRTVMVYDRKAELVRHGLQHRLSMLAMPREFIEPASQIGYDDLDFEYVVYQQLLGISCAGCDAPVVIVPFFFSYSFQKLFSPHIRSHAAQTYQRKFKKYTKFAEVAESKIRSALLALRYARTVVFLCHVTGMAAGDDNDGPIFRLMKEMPQFHFVVLAPEVRPCSSGVKAGKSIDKSLPGHGCFLEAREGKFWTPLFGRVVERHELAHFIIVPYVNGGTCGMLQKFKPTMELERPYVLSMVATIPGRRYRNAPKISFEARRFVASILQNNSDCFLHGLPSRNSTAGRQGTFLFYGKSNFCMAMGGDSLSSARLYQIVASLCVPIFTAPAHIPPFASSIPWSQFAVFANITCEADAALLLTQVRNISLAELIRRREIMAREAPKLLWDTGCGPSATDMVAARLHALADDASFPPQLLADDVNSAYRLLQRP